MLLSRDNSTEIFYLTFTTFIHSGISCRLCVCSYGKFTASGSLDTTEIKRLRKNMETMATFCRQWSRLRNIFSRQFEANYTRRRRHLYDRILENCSTRRRWNSNSFVKQSSIGQQLFQFNTTARMDTRNQRSFRFLAYKKFARPFDVCRPSRSNGYATCKKTKSKKKLDEERVKHWR